MDSRKVPGKNPLAVIEQRQRQELVQQQMQAARSANDHMTMVGRWERSSGHKAASKELYRLMDHVEVAHAEVLVQRRERLAALLLREKAEHDAMMGKLAETDDQRRERLMQRARELREQREVLRQQEAKAKRDQLIREKAEPIREAISHIKTLHVTHERQQQLDERARRRAAQAEEDEFYHQQQLAFTAQQTERAQRDLEERQQRTNRVVEDLNVQVECHQARKAEDRQRQREEDAEFYRLLREEEEATARKEDERRQRNAALMREMRERNEELKRIKKEEYEQLRREDREALDELLRQIAEDERREHEQKRKRREEAIEHMRRVEAQMSAQAESDTALDKLWQAENDREWEKRERQWMADQARRDAILRSVFEIRKQQVHEIRRAEQEATAQRQTDHRDLVDKLKWFAEDDLATAKKRRQGAVSVQDVLKQQMHERATAREKEREEARAPNDAALAEDAYYQERVRIELEKLESAKPAPYAHVPLVKSRRPL